jgi:hypothetical protein
MDQEAAQSGQGEASPIFDLYRRGYDPEQVDRFIAEQQRRLDESAHRASESERKLAAAVGQLRELHRRVAMLEGEDRSSQGPSLDMLGERVQRILQESWEGAYALRQSAEREVAEQREQADREVAELRERTRIEIVERREQAEREVAELLDAAQRRASLMRAETDRRRQAYLERVEEDRARAVNQITYLYDQRQLALGELARLQSSVESIVGEMAKSPLGVPSVSSRTGPRSVPLDEVIEDEAPMPAAPGGRHEARLARESIDAEAASEPEREVAREVAREVERAGAPAPASSSFVRARGRMPGLEQPISTHGAGGAGAGGAGGGRGIPAGGADRAGGVADGRDADEISLRLPPVPLAGDEPAELRPVVRVEEGRGAGAGARRFGGPAEDPEDRYVPGDPVSPAPRSRVERLLPPPRVFDFDDE